MPNGGSDCCGTCWFNRKNRGQPGYTHANNPEPDHCEIRDALIENPFWTYCANHPNHRPAGDRIPIGPIYAGHGGYPYQREVWRPSPNTEEVRQHLLELLNGFPESTSHDWYPVSPGLTKIRRDCPELLNGFPESTSHDWYPVSPGLIDIVIWQLGEFRESRAVPQLQWIAENGSDSLRDMALRALESVQS